MGGNQKRRFAHPTTGEMRDQQSRSPAADPTDLQSLIANLTCGDDQAAENAANAITALGEKALPALFDLLDADDTDGRWWALRTLAGIQHPEVPARLQSFLGTADPGLRQCAALGLSVQPCQEAIADLIEALEDEDRLLARLAGDALIATGGQALEILIEVLEKGGPAAKIEAARCLALIEDPQAIPALFEAWQDGSPMIQHWAEEGFERMGIGMQFFLPE